MLLHFVPGHIRVGSVIKAWDLGIRTMKKGEVAILTCAPDYAYGEKGSPPKIPPNATLIFEVELLDWKLEDISTDNDGSVQRRIISAGELYTNPKEDATVKGKRPLHWEIVCVSKYHIVVYSAFECSHQWRHI